ncbi:MAG: pyridoxal phosphate-dependent aminotransferase [Anaerolineae bacterium]
MTSSTAASKDLRVSRRALDVPWSGIRQMFELAAKVPDAISLAIGQPDFDTPAHIVEAGQRALAEGYTRYAPALGLLELREAVARKVWRENGLQIDPRTEAIVTAGAVEGLLLTLMATLDPGDEVILPDPAYTNYEGLIRVASGVPVHVPAGEEEGFLMRPDEVEAAITGRTRLLILNSPANPTGSVMLRPYLEQMAQVAQRHNLVVISDEAYEKFIYDGLEHVSLASLPGMKERTVSIYTLSKTYAMTGWRIGFNVGPSELIDHMHRMQEVVVSCVATFVQRAAVAALNGPQEGVAQMVAEYDARRRFIVAALNEVPGIRCAEPKGAFYVFPNVSALGRSSLEVAMSLLEDSRVICVPGTAFGPRGEGYLRISYAAPLDTLKEGVRRIREGAERLLRG